MKIIFAGSPHFAVPTLEGLAAAGHHICFVITQPDRPSGRHQEVHASPVKEAALKLGLPIYQPEKIKSDQVRKFLERLRLGVIVVVGYGQILPPWLLELPRYGCINLHGSLLPAYRGAAPIQWAISNGERKTGLTTMLMDAGMDTGPILLQWETEIGAEETAIELGERMSQAGPPLMVETLNGLKRGTLKPQPQDNSRASRAPLLKKKHGLIDWNMTAMEIYNRVRGFLPWPGAFTMFRGRKLQIWWAKQEDQSGDYERAATQPNVAGGLIVGSDTLSVACGGHTTLKLLELQLEGKRRISAAEFIRGARPRTGEKLGE